MSLSFNKNNLVNQNKEAKLVKIPVINNGYRTIDEIRKNMDSYKSKIDDTKKAEIVDTQLSHRDRVNVINNLLKK